MDSGSEPMGAAKLRELADGPLEVATAKAHDRSASMIGDKNLDRFFTATWPIGCE